jgi:glycosyltransferase involved in cell wall biosynthesis
MPRNELVTCVMVTRDRAHLAQRAIQCFLAQTYAPRELLIVNDGDHSYCDVIPVELPIDVTITELHLETEENNTLGELRNLGLDTARGEFIAQWDDDEWYHPDRLAIQISSIEQSQKAACALKWTLMHIDSEELVNNPFRADAGLATPGTIVHRRTDARYPAQRKGEDSVFIRSVKEDGGLCVLGQNYSHLFIRCFHGSNTWDFDHFLKRLRRTPRGLISLMLLKLLHKPITGHYAFDLSTPEQAAINEFKSDTFGLLVHAN